MKTKNPLILIAILFIFSTTAFAQSSDDNSSTEAVLEETACAEKSAETYKCENGNYSKRARHSRYEYKKDREDLQAMKVGFLTSKLNLTVEEAKAFWPVFSEYEEKKHKLEKEKRSVFRKPQEVKKEERELTDADIEAMIKKNFEVEQQLLDLKMEYDKKLRAVISLQKLRKLYKAEIDFKREMLGKLHGGHHGGRH